MSHRYYEEGPPASGRKVMLAVPTYDRPDTSLTFSLARSREALNEASIQSALLILEGNCHVDDARNVIVRDFLGSDCTELVFLDADVMFDPEGLVQLCRRDADIVGGVYPYRREGAETLPVRLLKGARSVDGLREVEGLPTGFMKIARHVLERMCEGRPWFYARTEPTVLMFDRPEPGDDHMRWGGDIDFCNRARALGFRIFADEEIRLGHVTKTILADSLAANLRRTMGRTIPHVIPKLRAGTETDGDFAELYRYAGNSYAADMTTLALCVGLARRCAGPIIETGSGLSSVAMAAVTEQPVYSLEHLQHYAGQTLGWGKEAGTGNLNVAFAPLADDLWYDISGFDLPQRFALGFCDGPPRVHGTRMRFFETFGDRCTVILADDITSEPQYASAVREWAGERGRSIEIIGRCALIRKAEPAALKEAA